MNICSRFSSFCCRTYKKTPRRTIKCKVLLLDGNSLSFNLNLSLFGSDLMNLVIHHLDVNERDYFGLKYKDKNNNMMWLDNLKKLRVITNNMTAPYEFYFSVKFYINDPDELKEELTLHHFFQQCKEDVKTHKLHFENKILVELVALHIQAHIGDFNDPINCISSYKPLIFTENTTDEFIYQVQSKHKELIGMTPSLCEKNFLTLFKKHDLYGTDIYTIKYGNDHEHFISFDPHGVKFNQIQPQTVFIAWNRIKRIILRKKTVTIRLHNEDPHISINYTIQIVNVRTARYIYKLAREHHVFFKLGNFSITCKGNIRRTKKVSKIYHRMGCVIFTGSEGSCKLHRHKCIKRRLKLVANYKKSTYGYARIGSNVLTKLTNGSYVNGIIIQLSKTVVMVCVENGIIIEHNRNTTDGIVCDSIPYESDIVKGTTVLFKQSENYYLVAKILSINEKSTSTKYLISYKNDQNYEKTIDEIRILKSPVYFGPEYDYSMQNQLTLTPKIPHKNSKEGQTHIDKQDDKNIEKHADTKLNEKNADLKLINKNIEMHTDTKLINKNIETSISSLPVKGNIDNSVCKQPIKSVLKPFGCLEYIEDNEEKSTFTQSIDDDIDNFTYTRVADNMTDSHRVQHMKDNIENSTCIKRIQDKIETSNIIKCIEDILIEEDSLTDRRKLHLTKSERRFEIRITINSK